MLRLSLDSVRNVLCLGAHADDIEIGCGGTLLKLLAKQPGIAVHWIVFSGIEPRDKEAAASAKLFLKDAGSSNVKQLAFRDSFFPYAGLDIKEQFASLAKTISPDLIFTHRRDDAHQDHRTLAELTWCTFRNHLVLEYEIPKYEGDLGAPNVFVALEPEVAQLKVDILVEAFASQHEKPWFSGETFYSLMRLRGMECNAPSKLAEGFYCRKIAF